MHAEPLANEPDVLVGLHDSYMIHSPQQSGHLVKCLRSSRVHNLYKSIRAKPACATWCPLRGMLPFRGLGLSHVSQRKCMGLGTCLSLQAVPSSDGDLLRWWARRPVLPLLYSACTI